MDFTLRHRRSVVLIMAAMAALAGGSLLKAGAANGSTRRASDQSRCTLASWHGSYGYVLTGSVFGPDGTKLADEAAVGVANPDGAGHVSGHDVASVNGTIVPRTWTATYTVDPDCSGTMNITTTSPPIRSFVGFIVVARNGRVLRIVDTDPGAVISGIATRL
jgi:hypothetical protein